MMESTMSTLTIRIPESAKDRLQEAAAKLGVSVEEMVQKSIEDYLDRKLRINMATDYVLKKNEELYRRLA
jgi:predicted transcriptional regulator